MSLPPPVVCATLGIVAGVAAVCDLRWRRVPNWISLAGFIAGLSLNVVLAGLAGARSALMGAGLALLIYLPLYLLRGVGAGDVKLMAALGAILGPGNWITVFVLTAITGGAVAVVLIVWRGRLGRTLGNLAILGRQLVSLRAPYSANPALDVSNPRAMTLPHAAVIAVGALEFIVSAWALRSH